eukprot:6191987-Pleurochrysis_carterae.AAC.1
MVVSNITNNNSPPESRMVAPGRSRKYKLVRYTANEDVRGLDWVALTARSDRAVTNGGTAVV